MCARVAYRSSAGFNRGQLICSQVVAVKSPPFFRKLIMLHIQTILVPIDFSDAADQALGVALSMARDHRAKLVLLTVPPPQPQAPISEMYVPEFDDVRLIDESRRQLKSLADSIADIPVEQRLVVGSPGHSIVDVAKECRADLIVMGTHGRSGLSRLILGSVAEHVLRHAPCPVLTIKPGAEEHLSRQAETSLTVSASS